MVMESALYKGEVYHQRVHPTQHEFTYNITLFWLKLNELSTLSESMSLFSSTRMAAYKFRCQDYLKHKNISNHGDLESAVKSEMQRLGSQQLSGDIFFLGQIRALGIFFSPVNFYFHRNPHTKKFDYMLAEVSNTPWNERHYYLVDLETQSDTQKAFHVSPFNPIDMTYKWQVAQPSKQLALALSCHQEKRHFTASLRMQKCPLTQSSMKKLMLTMPSTTLFSLIGIYWQALKLFLKRTPFYGNPGPASTHVQENNNVSK